jgi:hypothetical protein
MVGVRLGNRFHDRMIGCDISLEDGPVDGLRRITLGIGIIRHGRIARCTGASGAA